MPFAYASPAPAPRRLPALDGVRAIAILLVIPHNLNLITEPDGWFAHAMVSFLDRGWIGVQLFFVLSGFLITGLLLDARGAANYYASFFARRALRVLPLYYVTLIVLFVVLPAMGWFPASLPRHAGSELSYWFFVTNWYEPFHQGDGSMPHFWSLAVEEQFYLIWPFLLRRRNERQVMRLCLAIAGLSLGIRIVMVIAGVSSEAIYDFSVTRMDALALGASAAAALRIPALAARIASMRRRILVAAIGTLLGGAAVTRGYTFSGSLTLTFGYLLLALGFTLIVALAACADDPDERGWMSFLKWPSLRRVGKYSYAMYILHLPLHVLVGRQLLRALGLDLHPGILVNVAYLLLGTLASYAAAAISYRLVEVHFLRLKDRFEPRPALQYADHRHGARTEVNRV